MKKIFHPLMENNINKDDTDALIRFKKKNKNRIFTQAGQVSRFEKNWSKWLKCKYSVFVNSGSSANLLAVASLFYKKDNFLKRGDEVIVPAISWSTTYYPLQQYGLKLKFVDIDKETLNIKLSSLEKAITSKTKLIFAVNVLGNSN